MGFCRLDDTGDETLCDQEAGQPRNQLPSGPQGPLDLSLPSALRRCLRMRKCALFSLRLASLLIIIFTKILGVQSGVSSAAGP